MALSISVAHFDLHHAAIDGAMDPPAQLRRHFRDDAFVVRGAKLRNELPIERAAAIEVIHYRTVFAALGPRKADVAKTVADRSTRNDDLDLLFQLLRVVAPHFEIRALADVAATNLLERGDQKIAILEDDFRKGHVFAHCSSSEKKAPDGRRAPTIRVSLRSSTANYQLTSPAPARRSFARRSA